MNPNQHPKRAHGHRVLLSCALVTLGYAMSSASAMAAPAPEGHAYRCKQANGSVTYGQMPCSAQAELIKASDARTAAQLQQSMVNGEQDKNLAARMTRERRHDERAAAEPHALALTRPSRRHASQVQAVVSPGSVTPLPSTYKPHGHRHFRAVVPKSADAAKTVATAKPSPKP
jgi:hypothetical protein